MRKVSLSVLALLFAGSEAYKIGYRSLGQIKAENPAFVKFGNFGGQEDFLMISSFSAFGAGKVSVIPNISAKVASKDFANIKPIELSRAYTWPNKIEEVPAEVFGKGFNGISVPDGFLPPGHTDGYIYILETDPTDVTKKIIDHKITAKKSGFFYHMGKWVDINGDGRLDYLTARTNTKKGELVWFEHPEGGLSQVPWNEHVLTAGPDVMFELIEHPNYPNSHIVFASEFFGKELTVYEIEKKTGKVLQQRVIDNMIDQAYSVKYVDMDGDGKKELLVNNHEKDNKKAGVFLYYVPEDLFEGAFTKHIIASGFKNAFSITGMNMCPGFPYVVYPDVTKKSGQAHILIAGDGDHSAHLLRPTPDPEKLYEREVIRDFGGTIGAITVSDVSQTNSQFIQFYVANYDKGYIEVFEFYDADAAGEVVIDDYTDEIIDIDDWEDFLPEEEIFDDYQWADYYEPTRDEKFLN